MYNLIQILTHRFLGITVIFYSKPQNLIPVSIDESYCGTVAHCDFIKERRELKYLWITT